MTRGLWRLAVVMLAALGAASLNPAGAAETPRVPPDRQILVMVRHPPEHYRATGAYGGGYGDELGGSARLRIARSVARKYGLALIEDWPMPMIGIDCFVMAVPDARSTRDAANLVSHDANVAWAQPVELYGAKGAAARSHNDPLFAAEPSAAQWHLADLHQMSSGRGTRVAVIDSGIDARHPDLTGQIAVNRNFVSGQPLIAEQHGTAVAGIIAAKADNRIGIAGVAPGARLLGLRACWQSGSAPSTTCDTLSLAKALYFAVENRADVINLSLSGPDNRLLREIVSVALDRKLAVISAFDPKLPDGGFPASLSGVIAVSDSSLAGSRPDVYIAPGRDVPTTEPGGRWFLVNGSSFAAAHVSGLVALTRERRRSAPLALVSQRRGGGRIDACATLIRALGACDCSCGSGRIASAEVHR
jgi:subtilisin family serine protease